MKRNYILLAALLMAGGSVFAQKLSPNTTLMLMDNSTSVIGVKSTDQNETYIEAFIHVSDASVVDELKGLGVTVQSVFSDRLVTAAVPMSAIGQVADLAGVEYIQAGSADFKPKVVSVHGRMEVYGWWKVYGWCMGCVCKLTQKT